VFFNSPEFACFLPIVFIAYWFFSKFHNAQNVVLLIASYIFYGWWDVRFLLLIVASSTIDYFVGLGLEKLERTSARKLLLTLSVFANLGMLGVFKYYDFFVSSLGDGLAGLGFQANLTTLNLILPVGISFYTFQTLSYSIDVYRRKLKATKDPISFFTFVAFFPQLVAGPIERATNLLGQFANNRSFDFEDGREGARLILWGLFKKIVIADQCAVHVDAIFENYQTLSASVLLLGAIYFAFQIYGDFSGYSDIAIGTARLFGIRLMTNFKTPYFSRDVAEFWRRWHISLSTWFRDYVYIPLGGNRGGAALSVRNTFIVFLVSGLWHGANWTFVLWGLLHWIYFLPLLLWKRNRKNLNRVAEGRWLPSLAELLNMTLTFVMVTVAWVFFRAESIGVAFEYLFKLFDTSLFSLPSSRKGAIPWVGVLVLIEWIQRKQEHPLKLDFLHISFRWLCYLILAIVCLAKSKGGTEFIYFQF